jgi:hypothetical protein
MDEEKITPQFLYQLFILKIFMDRGGKAERGVVLDNIKIRFARHLSQKDLAFYDTGFSKRVDNYVGWARLQLVDICAMKKDSPRGLWEITEFGRKLYKEEYQPFVEKILL